MLANHEFSRVRARAAAGLDGEVLGVVFGWAWTMCTMPDVDCADGRRRSATRP